MNSPNLELTEDPGGIFRRLFKKDPEFFSALRRMDKPVVVFTITEESSKLSRCELDSKWAAVFGDHSANISRDHVGAVLDSVIDGHYGIDWVGMFDMTPKEEQ